MNEDISIREAKKSDIPLIARTLNSMYRLQRPGEFYSWQFFENANPSKLICGFKKGELIGTFGIQKRMLNNGLACGQLSWLNIAPKWQGRGWFRKLGEVALNRSKGLDVLCIFANANARSASERAFGFSAIGDIRTMALGSSGPIVGAPVKHSPVTLKTAFPPVCAAKNNAIMFQNTPRFLRWRLAQSPMYKYDIIKRNKRDFIITKIFIDPVKGTRYGDIVDFGCDSSDDEAIKTLYADACRHLNKKGAQQITTWATPATGLAGILKRSGFKETDEKTYFMVKVLKKNSKYLYEFARWHLKQADATNY